MKALSYEMQFSWNTFTFMKTPFIEQLPWTYRDGFRMTDLDHFRAIYQNKKKDFADCETEIRKLVFLVFWRCVQQQEETVKIA